MRYHYEPPAEYTPLFGETYICDHPVYSECTLYRIGERGLAVIQQRYSAETKHTWWSSIDPWLINELYLHPKFKSVFDKRSGISAEGIFPTISVRQLMWALKMKPMKRERWETCFDKKDI